MYIALLSNVSIRTPNHPFRNVDADPVLAVWEIEAQSLDGQVLSRIPTSTYGALRET
jgi:hypothetical protein